MSKLLIILIVMITNGTVGSASPFTADLDFDFKEGRILIEPAIPLTFEKSFLIGKNDCWGICFNRFTFSGSAKKRGASNSYFFLQGDPDNLSFYILSFGCSGPRLGIVNYVNHKFQVLKGNFSVQGYFASGKEIVANVLFGLLNTMVRHFPGFFDYVSGRVPVGYGYPAENPADYANYVCTDEFRQKYANHNLNTLADHFGNEFATNFDGDTIEVTWDAKNWQDKMERESRDVINKAKLLLSIID